MSKICTYLKMNMTYRIYNSVAISSKFIHSSRIELLISYLYIDIESTVARCRPQFRLITIGIWVVEDNVLI